MHKPRKPFLALLFSIAPGLGQVYNGQLVKGFLFLLLEVTLMFLLNFTELFMNQKGFIFFLIVTITGFIYRAADAFFIAKKRKDYILLPFNKELFYGIFVSAVFIVYTVFRLTATTGIQTFNIPTGSMAQTILPGDKILAQLHYYDRHELKNNDLVIFHYPQQTSLPIYSKTYYVSRCVGRPNDTIIINRNKVYIHGGAISTPAGLQHIYQCYTKSTSLSEKARKKYGIHTFDIPGEFMPIGNTNCCFIHLTDTTVQQLQENNIFDSIVPVTWDRMHEATMLFPHASKTAHWSNDNYGPLWIPLKGAMIKLDSNMVEAYGMTIKNYEGLKEVELAGDKLLIKYIIYYLHTSDFLSKLVISTNLTYIW